MIDIIIPIGKNKRLVAEHITMGMIWRLQHKSIGVLFSYWVTDKKEFSTILDNQLDVILKLVGEKDYQEYVQPKLIKA